MRPGPGCCPGSTTTSRSTLDGRQLAAGQQPSRGGGNPFLSGPAGEWAAARAAAVDEAVPRIVERLRPKYGRMYNFDDAQPGNVRLLAMSVQPSLTNRLAAARPGGQA